MVSWTVIRRNAVLCLYVDVDTPPQCWAYFRSLSWMSTRPSRRMKFSCFCRVNGLVSPSAGMLLVEIHWIEILFAWTSWRNQCWWMSTCRSFVDKRGWSSASNRIVWRLSQSIWVLCPGSKSNALKSRFHQRASFAAAVSANNSASVLEVVTVDCFVAFHAIGLP